MWNEGCGESLIQLVISGLGFKNSDKIKLYKNYFKIVGNIVCNGRRL